MPTLGSLFQIRSFRCAPEPIVEFDRHRRKEVPLVHSLKQVFTESAASGIVWRPDPDSRHDSADGVDDLPGNSLGFYGARPSLFEASVKLPQSFLWRFLSRAAARGRRRARSTTLSLFRGCHCTNASRNRHAVKDYRGERKRPIMFP